jgi:hypothetical protein
MRKSEPFLYHLLYRFAFVEWFNFGFGSVFRAIDTLECGLKIEVKLMPGLFDYEAAARQARADAKRRQLPARLFNPKRLLIAQASWTSEQST